MRMLTDQSDYFGLVRYLNDDYTYPMGVTRRLDGEWINIYTNEKTFTQMSSYSRRSIEDGFGSRDFVHVKSTASYYLEITHFVNRSSLDRTICIAPKEGESIEIDFCGTGFHDCHEGALCTNGGDKGYTCECQPLQFGHLKVSPVDVAGTGRSCSYTIPGHDDKSLTPIRVNNIEGSILAFHASLERYIFEDAIKYCAELGMHLPLPQNDQENTAMRKISSNVPYTSVFWLGIQRSDEDNIFRNIYTEEELSYTNWEDRHLRGKPLAAFNGGREKYDNSGKWAPVADRKIWTICQMSDLASKINWCETSLHNCHVEANCLPYNDENETGDYQCKCKDQEQYTGDGRGENGCVFKLESKFRIDNYKVDVTINDRYVRTQIAVSVTNRNTKQVENYEFGVNLDQFEFISGLTMRIGANGDVFNGDVHKEKEAQQIFDDTVSNGSGSSNGSGGSNQSGGAQSGSASSQAEPVSIKDTTFAVKAKFQIPRINYPG